MATASKKLSTPPSKPSKGRATEAGDGPLLLRVAESVYRFLASLQLAIVSLGTLATVLFLGMLFERKNGNEALQQYVYRTWWFGVLLAMLGLNILCAATIRYPWKKRQTGFVVTHAGLLVLLVGSWISFQTGDEGQVAMTEGAASSQLVRTHQYSLRVQPVDEQGRSEGGSFEFPFYPGPFAWKGDRTETLTRPDDPFTLEVVEFLPSSQGKLEVLPDGHAHGAPAVKLSMELTPPTMISPIDPLQDQFVVDENRWLVGSGLFKRKTRSVGPAQLTLQYVEGGPAAREVVDDFLALPGDGKVEVARLHYQGTDGRTRTAVFLPGKESWVLPDGTTAEGRTVALPESDLTATYRLSGTIDQPAILDRLMRVRLNIGGADGEEAGRAVTLGNVFLTIMQETGDDRLPLAEFAIREGDGPEVVHWSTGIHPLALPLPLSFTEPAEPAGFHQPAAGLARVAYYHPPAIANGMQGLKGVVEILAVGSKQLYYRTINGEGLQEKGELEIGEKVAAFGGDGRAMKVAFSVDDYVESGIENFTFTYVEMPVSQAGQGIPAARIKMTAGGRTQEQWVRLSVTPDFKNDPSSIRTFDLSDRHRYAVSYDVGRDDLPFRLKLVDFRRRFDPGTQQASSYESDVLLYDEEAGIDGEKRTISMNEPLTHRGYTFYQSSFDPPSGGEGEFISVFQVRYDPTWYVIYLGCLMVVIGTFLQFYMRAGVFTDGGKRERRLKGVPETPLEPGAAEPL